LSPTDDAAVLVQSLNLELEPGRRLTVCGPSRAGRTALFRAVAGLHECGSGNIARPPHGQISFIPEHPYLPTSTLRELLAAGNHSNPVTDDQIHEILTHLGLASVIKHSGGLDVPKDWGDSLSFHETKIMAAAQTILAKPRYAFMMGLSALDESGRRRILDLMEANGITFVTFGSQRPDSGYQGACLELRDDGSWDLLKP
jgi:vitamin B12/bleomycin/antimicrobial peptide transport system ATP-binding/permease protein